MLNIFDESICKSLGIIFQSCLENGKFPSEWKKVNMDPAFKKNCKQELKNYRPISLLPVSGKIFERLLYDSVFTFFTENSFISRNQLGFISGYSWTNQLLSIAHQIYVQIRSVFLDMSKTFDKVWRKDLIFKFRQNSISGSILSTLTDFLKLRKQRVVSNGQLSSCSNIESGISKGCILGLLLFLIYINDLSESLTINARLFADDVSLFSVINIMNFSATNLNRDLRKISALTNQWKMTLNPDLSKQAREVILSRKIKKTSHHPLNFNNKSVKQVQFQKHLGVYLDCKMDICEHLQNMFKKANKTLSLLHKLQNNLPRAPLVTIYKPFIRLRLDYWNTLYDQIFNNFFHEKLESIQYNLVLAKASTIGGSSKENFYQEQGFEFPPATTVIQDTLSLFQNNKKISQVRLWTNTKCWASLYDKI